MNHHPMDSVTPVTPRFDAFGAFYASIAFCQQHFNSAKLRETQELMTVTDARRTGRFAPRLDRAVRTEHTP